MFSLSCSRSLSLQGDVEAAKELLDQGADPNLKDHAGWTPLVRHTHMKTLTQLMSVFKLYLKCFQERYVKSQPYLFGLRDIHTMIVLTLHVLGISFIIQPGKKREPAVVC